MINFNDHSNVTPYPNHHTFIDEEHYNVIREVKCQMCSDVLAGVVSHAPDQSWMYWPFQVECVGRGRHILRPRALGVDAKVVVQGRSVSEAEANKYLQEAQKDIK